MFTKGACCEVWLPFFFITKELHTFGASFDKKGVYIMTAMELQQWKQNFIHDYPDEIAVKIPISSNNL